MWEVELFNCPVSRRLKMAEQALVIGAWLQYCALRTWLIQQQVMCHPAQPALHIVGSAPLLFTNQQMQATVKGLPRIVATNAVFRRPVDFEITERPIVETTNQRECMFTGELAFQIGDLYLQ